MGANPHANGGILLRELRMPDFREYAVAVPTPGGVNAEDTSVLGKFLRDIVRLNQEAAKFSRVWTGRNCIQPPERRI